VFGDGAYASPAADYAEYFECEDSQGLPPGRLVTLNDKGKLILSDIDSDSEEVMIGITSVNPTVIGDAAWSYWTDKYLKDEFGRVVKEHGKSVLNPKFDPSIPYIPREQRKEWVAVGMVGKLWVETEEPIREKYVGLGKSGKVRNLTYDSPVKLRVLEKHPSGKTVRVLLF
jgi:hypothetical protein